MAIGAGDRSGREHIESSAPVTSAHQGSSSRIASEAIARLDLSLFHLGDATASGDISHRPGTATKAFRMVELAAPSRSVPAHELPGPVFAPEDEGKLVSVCSFDERRHKALGSGEGDYADMVDATRRMQAAAAAQNLLATLFAPHGIISSPFSHRVGSW